MARVRRTSRGPALACLVASVTIVAAAGSGVATAAGAGLAPEPVWQPPLPVSAADGTAAEAVLTIGATGVQTAVWLDDTGGSAHVLASSRAPGAASWSDPVPLSDPASPASDLHVESGPGTRVTAVWLSATPGGPTVDLAESVDGSGWQPAQTLSTPGEAVAEPDLEISPAGEGAVIWRRDVEVGDSEIVLMRRDRDSSAWRSADFTVTRTRAPFEPQVAINDLGDSVVVWLNSGGMGERLMARFHNSMWDSGMVVAASTADSAPGRFMLVGSSWSNRLVYEWTTPQGTEIYGRVNYVGWSSFDPAFLVSDPGVDSTDPHAAVFDDTWVATWQAAAGPERHLMAAYSPGAQATGFDLGAIAPDSASTLAEDLWQRRAAAGWQTPDGQILAATFGSAGPTVAPVASAGTTATLAIDPYGDAVAGWLLGDGSPDRLHARTLDAPGPLPLLRVTGLPRGRKPVTTLRWQLPNWESVAVAGQQLRMRQIRFTLGARSMRATPEPPALQTKLRGKPGHTYCLQLRATDALAGTSAWSNEQCTTFPVDDRAGTSRHWAKRSPATAYLGTTSVSTRRGATLTFTGQNFHNLYLLVTTSPTSGKVDVAIDGSTVATVNLQTPTARKRVLVPIWETDEPWNTPSVRHTVQLVARSGKPVTIDGLVPERHLAHGWKGGD